MARSRSQSTRPPPPTVQYAPVGVLKVFEVTESDLDRLEAGPAGQLHLNFALAMLPAALTVLVTLLTTSIESTKLYVGFHVAFWALAVQGAISLGRWFFARSSYRDIIAEIRARMPVQPVEAEQIVLVREGSSGGEGTPRLTNTPETASDSADTK